MKPLVKNAASKEQVENAAFEMEERRNRELNDLRLVLSTKEGRRVMWRFMSHCKAFEGIWDGSARIHYNSGRQDVGHFLIKEVEAADQDAFFTMMKEAKENLKNV